MDDSMDVDEILDEVEAEESKVLYNSAQINGNVTIYPLDSVISNGISSLHILDLARNLSPGGVLGYTARDSLYAKSCEKDRNKLYRSAALLQRGEEFAIKASGYSMSHGPLYLRYYEKNKGEDYRDDDYKEGLLGQSIDELFSKLLEKNEPKKADSCHESFQFIRKRKHSSNDSDSNESWLIKYNPRYFSDLLTEEAVNIEVLNWLSSWKCSNLHNRKKTGQRSESVFGKAAYKEKTKDGSQDADNMRKILLLGGPAGVGKSTLVNVLSRHCGFDVVEVNASDDRSKTKLLPIIKGIIMANAISKDRPNLCLLEEVDGLHAGEGQIIGALKELDNKGSIKRPIVCICNDLYNKNLRELRQIAKVVLVETCDAEALKDRLLHIAECEGYKVEEEIIEELMTLHHNDVRSCVTALEFIIKNPTLYNNLDVFAKDRSQDLLVFLKSLFNPKLTPSAVREASLSVASTLGTHATCNLVLENVFKIGIKSQFNTIALYDLLSQGDILQNTSWIQVVLSFVKMMRLKSAFNFILPMSLCSHTAGLQMTKNSGIIRIIRSHANVASAALSSHFTIQVLPTMCMIITALRGSSGSAGNVTNAIKDIDILWEAFGPIKGTTLNRMIKLATLLQLYGINVVEVQDNMSLDPPILDLSCIKNITLDYETCKMLKLINQAKPPKKSGDRPKNLQLYVQEMSKLGFYGFMKKYKPANGTERSNQTKSLCRKDTPNIPPLTFTELLEQETLHLASVLKASDLDLNTRTSGIYKFQVEQCGAVRYIINDI